MSPTLNSKFHMSIFASLTFFVLGLGETKQDFITFTAVLEEQGRGSPHVHGFLWDGKTGLAAVCNIDNQWQQMFQSFETRITSLTHIFSE